MMPIRNRVWDLRDSPKLGYSFIDSVELMNIVNKEYFNNTLKISKNKNKYLVINEIEYKLFEYVVDYLEDYYRIFELESLKHKIENING